MNSTDLTHFIKLPDNDEKVMLSCKIDFTSQDGTARVLPQIALIYIADESNNTKGSVVLYNKPETFTSRKISVQFDITKYGRYVLPIIYSASSRQEFTIEFSISSGDGISSIFRKNNVNFTGIPVAYYAGETTYTEGFDSSTTTDDMITAFDTLLSDYGANYMTKTALGL